MAVAAVVLFAVSCHFGPAPPRLPPSHRPDFYYCLTVKCIHLNRTDAVTIAVIAQLSDCRADQIIILERENNNNARPFFYSSR